MKDTDFILKAVLAILIGLIAIQCCAADTSFRPTQSQIDKAMLTHWRAHPNCYVCDTPHSLLKTAPRLGTNFLVVSRINLWSPCITNETIYIIPGKWKRNPVHHIKSQHAYPWLAADPDNLVTLCYRHHGMYGHGVWIGKGSWAHSNTNLMATLDAARFIWQHVGVYVREATHE